MNNIFRKEGTQAEAGRVEGQRRKKEKREGAIIIIACHEALFSFGGGRGE